MNKIMYNVITINDRKEVFSMNGFTIKSISEEGEYYLVKNWRKNKALWVKETELRQEYLYNFASTAIRGLVALLNAMDDYATDKLSIVSITDENISHYKKLSVKNESNSEWENDYKVYTCD